VQIQGDKHNVGNLDQISNHLDQ